MTTENTNLLEELVMKFKDFLADHPLPDKVIAVDQCTRYLVLPHSSYYLPVVQGMCVDHAEITSLSDNEKIVLYLKCPDGILI